MSLDPALRPSSRPDLSLVDDPVRVLLVEDRAADARLVRELLSEVRRPPTLVVHKEDLASALDYLRLGRVDVVLLDLGLPDSRGAATVSTVLEACPSVPVVVLTGRVDPQLTASLLAAGAQDYLDKCELSPELLSRSIRYAVERKRGEIRRAEEARFLQELVSHISDVLVIVDEDGRILYESPSARHVLGVEPEDRIGGHVGDLLHPDDREVAAELLERSLREPAEVRRVELRIRRDDGEWRSVEALGKKLPPGSGGDRALITVRDVTDRRRREEKLRRRTYELGERVKEQGCLYGVTRALEARGVPLEARLQEIADLLPPGWQYPDVTVGRVEVEGDVRTSEGYRETAWRLISEIEVDGEPAGEVEVAYLEERPEEDEGPFLEEERRLLDEIAARIGAEIARLRAREELERSEERYRSLFDRHPDVAYSMDLEGRLLSGNRAGQDATGLDADELQGRHFREFVHPDHLERTEEEFRRAAAGEPRTYETVGIGPGQELTAYQVTNVPMTVGGETAGVFGIARDVTTRKAAERELRESRERLQRLVQTMNEAVVIVDVRGRLTFANRAAEELLGVGGEELAERTFDDPAWKVTGVTGEALPDDEFPVRRVLDSGAPVRNAQHAFERPDGTRVLVSVNAAPLRDPEGAVSGVVASLRDVTDLKRREEKLRNATQFLESLLQATPAIVFRQDLATLGLTYTGPNVERITGFPPERFTEDPGFWEGRIPAVDVEAVRSAIEEGVTEGRSEVEAEFRFRHADGDLRWFFAAGRIERDEEGRPSSVVAAAVDVTERKAATRALAESERRYRTLFEGAQEAIAVTSPEGEFLDVNPAWLELFGYDPEELDGRRAEACFVNGEDHRRFREALENQGYARQMEVQLQTAGGVVLDCLISSTATRQADGSVQHRTFIRDISELKRFEEELRHRALHDILTELPNRALLNDRLEQAVNRANRHGAILAVHFVDLDRFKAVNDSYGHARGDQVLTATARCLESAVRGQDTVARIGGDEFVVIAEDLRTMEDVEVTASRIAEALQSNPEITDPGLRVTASIGVAAYDGRQRPAEPDDLLRRADIAMYRAKERSGTTVHLFDPGTDSAGLGRIQREQDLRRGLRAGEFSPDYQPIFELDSGRLRGVELLARWDHPERGRLGAGDFIPLAEETGLVLELGEQLLEQGLADFAGWRDGQGHRDPAPLPGLFFNLSALQFDDPELPGRIEEVLSRAGLPAGALCLEVTETEIMRSTERVQPLRDLGVHIVVDDFGTGYSSLAYLRDLAVDALKIDLSFVHGAPEHREDRAIVETIVKLGNTLGLQIVAEGIETEPQHRLLRELGCDLGQGYYFGRPVPAAGFRARWLGGEGE